MMKNGIAHYWIQMNPFLFFSLFLTSWFALDFKDPILQYAWYGALIISWLGMEWIRYYSNQPLPKPFLLHVEGNIGSGKSTFLKLLKETYGNRIEIIYEPVSIWQQLKDSNGKDILDYFYTDMSRWAYTMQNYVFITRVLSLLPKSETKEQKERQRTLRVAERSIYTDYHIFASMCYENGKMNELENQIYQTWFKALENEYLDVVKPDAILYLKTHPEIALSRMQKRGREEEKTVELDYLTRLSLRHDEMMQKMDCPVFIMDANQDFEEDDTMKKDMFHQFHMFLKQFEWDDKKQEWICKAPGQMFRN